MISVALCCAAPEEGGDIIRALRAFAPPVADAVGPLPYASLQSMFDASAPFGINAYWKTEHLTDILPGTVDAIVRFAAEMPAPFSAIHVHHVEGAVRRLNDEDSAVGHREAPYILNVLGMCSDPRQGEETVAWARACHGALEPFSDHAGYLNFLGDDGQERIRDAYGPARFRRLSEVKRAYDPTNLFRLNQNITPAARGPRNRVSRT